MNAVVCVQFLLKIEEEGLRTPLPSLSANERDSHCCDTLRERNCSDALQIPVLCSRERLAAPRLALDQFHRLLWSTVPFSIHILPTYSDVVSSRPNKQFGVYFGPLKARVDSKDHSSFIGSPNLTIHGLARPRVGGQLVLRFSQK